jgi:hypothetical protein
MSLQHQTPLSGLLQLLLLVPLLQIIEFPTSAVYTKPLPSLMFGVIVVHVLYGKDAEVESTWVAEEDSS